MLSPRKLREGGGGLGEREKSTFFSRFSKIYRAFKWRTLQHTCHNLGAFAIIFKLLYFIVWYCVLFCILLRCLVPRKSHFPLFAHKWFDLHICSSDACLTQQVFARASWRQYYFQFFEQSIRGRLTAMTKIAKIASPNSYKKVESEGFPSKYFYIFEVRHRKSKCVDRQVCSQFGLFFNFLNFCCCVGRIACYSSLIFFLYC